MLSHSKVVCKAYVDNSVFSQASNLSQYTRQGWSFRCSLCRGTALFNDGLAIAEQSPSQDRLSYSALKTDADILADQSAGARSVILTGLVDDATMCAPSYQDIEGG